MASIIGIDLGKFKSVTCIYDSETTEASFATLPTDPEALSKALDRHNEKGGHSKLSSRKKKGQKKGDIANCRVEQEQICYVPLSLVADRPETIGPAAEPPPHRTRFDT